MADNSASTRPRYDNIYKSYKAGVLTCGFLWDLAAHDEVFGAYLRKMEVPKE